MIEQIVIEYLSGKTGIPVFAEEPERKPREYFVVTRSAFFVRDFICTASVQIWSNSDSLLHAAELDKVLRDAMDGIIEIDDVSKCTLENSYNDTDESSRSYRYRAEFELIYFE